MESKGNTRVRLAHCGMEAPSEALVCALCCCRTISHGYGVAKTSSQDTAELKDAGSNKYGISTYTREVDSCSGIVALGLLLHVRDFEAEGFSSEFLRFKRPVSSWFCECDTCSRHTNVDVVLITTRSRFRN